MRFLFYKETKVHQAEMTCARSQLWSCHEVGRNISYSYFFTLGIADKLLYFIFGAYVGPN